MTVAGGKMHSFLTFEKCRLKHLILIFFAQSIISNVKNRQATSSHLYVTSGCNAPLCFVLHYDSGYLLTPVCFQHPKMLLQVEAFDTYLFLDKAVSTLFHMLKNIYLYTNVSCALYHRQPSSYLLTPVCFRHTKMSNYYFLFQNFDFFFSFFRI